MQASHSLDTEHLRSVNRLLEAALALPEAQRAAWLRALPAEQAIHAPLLRALLARTLVETDTFMRRPVMPFDALLTGHDAELGPRFDADLDAPGDSAGALVGPYRLIRELGQGGMSVVWLAERADGTLRRQVALKLPRTGWSAGLAERMARERDILAALEHPNIARLYDAGVTAAGRPYLAMEFVDGQPIDAYVRTNDLGIEARLQLFVQVTRAVAHAHANLVVHRDLKPTNILVTFAGEVRLLDFGVAKLLAGDPARDSQLTQWSGRAFTPDYASPEQVRGEPLAVASDVYSLGVVLYELLTGERPYKVRRDSAAALEEAIVDVDVPLASVRVSVASRLRDRTRLARRLRGDLDTVLAKALRKEPARRYSSVEAFAADIQRHLDGEPVHARPRSRSYLLARFVRRHRLPISAAAAVALALLAGAGVAVWQAREAVHQAELARLRFAQSEASVEFMTMVLTEGLSAGDALTLDDVVRRSEVMADSLKAASPIERALAADAVAAWYISYGAYERAEQLLTRTLESLPAGFDTRRLRCKRAHATSALGGTEKAIAELDTVIAASAGDASTASYCLQQRARIARNLNDAGGALRYAEQAQQMFVASGRTSPRTGALLMAELGYGLSLNGRPAAAQERYRSAAAQFEAIGRQESPSAISVYNNWAIALLNAGNPKGALEQLERSVAIGERRSPTKNAPSYVHTNRGSALRALARYGESLQAYEQAVQIARKERSAPIEVHALAGQVHALHSLGRIDEAQRKLVETHEAAQRGAVAPDSPGVLAARTAQAVLWQAQGRLGDADALFADVQAQYARLNLRIGAVALTAIARADIALAASRHGDALAHAEQALAVAQLTQGDFEFSLLTGQASLALARAFFAHGDLPRARVACQRALEHLARSVAADHALMLDARRLSSELGRESGT